MIRLASRLCLLVFLPVLFASSARAQALSRRQFLTSSAACASLLLTGSSLEAGRSLRMWPVDPALDFDRMGLDSFGRSVRDLLLVQNLASGDQAEAIRWKVQDLIWARLSAETPVNVAIRLSAGRYLLLRPSFNADVASDQSVQRITLVRSGESPGGIPYQLAPRAPAGAHVIAP